MVDITLYDKKDIYCRALGHRVPFSYCRAPGSTLFCRNLVRCWAGHFDAVSFLKSHWTEEQIRDALTPPKPKVNTLVELIQKARGSTG